MVLTYRDETGAKHAYSPATITQVLPLYLHPEKCSRDLDATLQIDDLARHAIQIQAFPCGPRITILVSAHIIRPSKHIADSELVPWCLIVGETLRGTLPRTWMSRGHQD